MGILAGPIGIVAGAGMGAVTAGLLGHKADAERHESDSRSAAVDEIDAEEEFFHQARALGVAAPAATEARTPFVAIALLRDEHREIERLLAALDHWAGDVAADRGGDERNEAARFVRVLRSFVADWHHAREEGILFQALDQACSSRERGPVLVMAHEHQLLDRLVAELEALASSARPWGTPERERAIESATTYGDLLRRHIVKEEAVVYPMAEARLASEARREVDVRMEAFALCEGNESLETLGELSASLIAAHSSKRIET